MNSGWFDVDSGRAWKVAVKLELNVASVSRCVFEVTSFRELWRAPVGYSRESSPSNVRARGGNEHSRALFLSTHQNKVTFVFPPKTRNHLIHRYTSKSPK